MFTGIMSHDIGYTLQSMGMVKKSSSGEPIVVVDWSIVESYVEKAASNKTRIEIDPECLRWTPLISPILAKQLKEVR